MDAFAYNSSDPPDDCELRRNELGQVGQAGLRRCVGSDLRSVRQGDRAGHVASRSDCRACSELFRHRLDLRPVGRRADESVYGRDGSDWRAPAAPLEDQYAAQTAAEDYLASLGDLSLGVDVPTYSYKPVSGYSPYSNANLH
jgi:hypothetical protein